MSTTTVSIFYLNFLDKGYANSAESGQDRLVTDNISNRFKEALNRQLFGNMFSTDNVVPNNMMSINKKAS